MSGKILAQGDQVDPVLKIDETVYTQTESMCAKCRQSL